MTYKYKSLISFDPALGLRRYYYDAQDGTVFSQLVLGAGISRNRDGDDEILPLVIEDGSYLSLLDEYDPCYLGTATKEDLGSVGGNPKEYFKEDIERVPGRIKAREDQIKAKREQFLATKINNNRIP